MQPRGWHRALAASLGADQGIASAKHSERAATETSEEILCLLEVVDKVWDDLAVAGKGC
jgi:hypothetical protein